MAEVVKIYVINLERSVERRNEIIKIMKKYSIPFEFFEGIDGNKLSEEFIDQCRTRSNNWYQEDEGAGKSMKKGEIGVAMSHYYIYQKMQAEDIKYAIILEDDAEFDQRFQQFVKRKTDLEDLMKKFDLLLLAYCGHDADYYKPGVCSYWYRKNINKSIMAGVPVKWYWSAMGYLISKKGAELLVDKQGEFPCVTADILTANSPQYGVRLGILRKQIVWPALTSTYSTIQLDNRNHHVPNLGKGGNYSPGKGTKKSHSNSTRSTMIKKTYRTLSGILSLEKLKLSRRFYQFTTNRY